jgi:hypothetical protein
VPALSTQPLTNEAERLALVDLESHLPQPLGGSFSRRWSAAPWQVAKRSLETPAQRLPQPFPALLSTTDTALLVRGLDPE